MIFGTVEKWGNDGHALKGKGTGIKNAVKAGFDTFDTAPGYLNEKEVGNDLEGNFRVQSKLDYFKWGYENVIEEFENSSEHLSITTYLIHWPVLPLKELKETWRAFEHLKNQGQVEKIGVCNFTIKHLQKLLDICEIPPDINQFELNIFCQNDELINECKRHNIEVQSYSSICRGRPPSLPGATSISLSVMLDWLLSKGVNPIVRSTKINRLQEMIKLESGLTERALENYKEYDRQFRLCPDPNTMGDWS
jgi:diketogulonate reductase-like aldo/keto reductase